MGTLAFERFSIIGSFDTLLIVDYPNFKGQSFEWGFVIMVRAGTAGCPDLVILRP